MKVYVDESGHTGADLLNDDQTIFAVASNTFSNEEAADIFETIFGDLEKHYPHANEPGFEIKHNLLAGSQPGRQRVIELIQRIRSVENKTFIYSTHKEFALLCIIIDQWIETAHYEKGMNFYAYDNARYYARIVFYSFLTSRSRQLLREFLRICVGHIRKPSIDWLRALSTLMEAGFAHDNEVIRDFFHLIDWSLQTIGPSRTSPQALDLATTSLVSTASFWQTAYSGRLQIVHDESNEVAKNVESWKQLMNANVEGAAFGFGEQRIEFPLRIDNISFVKSSSSLQIQISDVLAGAVAEHMRWVAGLDQSKAKAAYAEKLDNAGIVELNIDGIYPLQEFEPEDEPAYGNAQEALQYITQLNTRH